MTKGRRFVSFALALLLAAPLAFGQQSGQINKAKVYVTTSTYGVMAGSMVGVATLAFYKKPGTHLRNIAIGASLGLYTGIMLGTYLVYFVPDMKKSQSAPAPSAPTPKSSEPEGDPDDPLGIGKGGAFNEIPTFVPIASVNPDGSWQAGLEYHF
jgi:hypothetical protein